jgi:hypothetical protein
MNCIDCHNHPAHSFDTPEGALNRAMAAGTPSPAFPYSYKQGMALIKADYSSQTNAAAISVAMMVHMPANPKAVLQVIAPSATTWSQWTRPIQKCCRK